MSNKQDLSLAIETLVKDKGFSYLEACVEQASEMDVDIEELAPLLSRSIKDRLEVEAINNRVIRVHRPKTLEQIL